MQLAEAPLDVPGTRSRPGRGTRRARTAIAALIAAAVIASCSSGSDAPASTSQAGAASVASLPPGAEPTSDRLAALGDQATGKVLARATTIAQLPSLLTSLAPTQGGGEFLVGDRAGLIRRVKRASKDGLMVPELDQVPVLDLRSNVSTGAENGFFDLALTPDDTSLLVSYSTVEGEEVVEKYAYEPGEAVDRSTKQTVVSLDWPYPYHHGGGLAFDRKGNLLLSLGDQGLVALPGEPTGTRGTLTGSVLSIPRRVVADPANSGWAPSSSDLVAVGFRNPWRISVDPRRGDLYIGDVGDHRAEEVNRVPVEQLGKQVPDFGWPFFEGSLQQAKAPKDGGPYEPAILERRHGEGTCGIIGGVFYEGSFLPSLQGQYVYGDLCGHEVRAMDISNDGEVSNDRRIATLPTLISSLAVGPLGEIYALGSDGSLIRLDPAAWTVRDNDQRPTKTEIDPNAPVDKTVDCGIIDAIAPFGTLPGMDPDEIRATLAKAKAELAERVPRLPAHLQPAGRVVQRTVDKVDARLASVGYDLQDPRLSDLRDDVIGAVGTYEGFGDALKTFMQSECK